VVPLFLSSLTPFRQYKPIKKGSGTPTDVQSNLRTCGCGALLREGSPIGVPPRLSPQRVSHPHGSVSGQASWDVVCVGVTQLRLSQSSVAPHTPVIVPEGMMPEPPGTGCMAPPRAPHSLRAPKGTPAGVVLDERGSQAIWSSQRPMSTCVTKKYLLP